jgi:3,4-dihydroxy 2-butanone 4-phosphate synthase/GTP cyclohydrolase II
LIAKQGVLRRTGHTRAIIDYFWQVSNRQELSLEIMNEDGTHVYPISKVAKKFDLKLVSIEALAYRMQHDSLIVKKEEDYI